MKEIELSRHGTLYSYTTTYYPVSNFKPPHTMGLIDLPEGVRILAPLITSDKGFKVGTEMEMIIDTVWIENDEEVIGYKFR